MTGFLTQDCCRMTAFARASPPQERQHAPTNGNIGTARMEGAEIAFKQRAWHGDIGNLEGKIAAVVDDLRTDLDQLFLKAGQRPVLDRLGHRESAQESYRDCRLGPDGIGSERTARQPRPVDSDADSSRIPGKPP
jgi:hypothetical protein